jgi:hypothetical protein
VWAHGKNFGFLSTSSYLHKQTPQVMRSSTSVAAAIFLHLILAYCIAYYIFLKESRDASLKLNALIFGRAMLKGLRFLFLKLTTESHLVVEIINIFHFGGRDKINVS